MINSEVIQKAFHRKCLVLIRIERLRVRTG